jgi:hypothetical protein
VNLIAMTNKVKILELSAACGIVETVLTSLFTLISMNLSLIFELCCYRKHEAKKERVVAVVKLSKGCTRERESK